jgi:hypothetical protein
MNAFRALASACLFATATTSAMAVDFASLPNIGDLPSGYIQVSPLIPMLGEHYDDQKLGTVPHGQAYCGYKGKIICIEYLMTPADFAAGKSFKDLHGVAGLPPVDHIDLDFEAQGHGDWKDIALYMLRVYFISTADLAAMTP